MIEEDGEELEIYRRSTPYGTVGEHGLYFLGFSAELSRFDKMLARMFGMSRDGVRDHLTDFTTPVSGSYYFAPSLEALDGHPPVGMTSCDDPCASDGQPDRRRGAGGRWVRSPHRWRVAAAVSTPQAKSPRYEETIHLAVDDLQDYWTTELPALYGVDYRKIPDVEDHRLHVDVEDPAVRTRAGALQGRRRNAFYCNAGKFVAYDDENLFPQLDKEFGDFTIALTLAHEWGHAVQDQAGITGPTIALEQQADCFAGAWVRHVGDGDRRVSACTRATSTPASPGSSRSATRPGAIRPPTGPTGARSTASARSRRATTAAPSAARTSRQPARAHRHPVHRRDRRSPRGQTCPTGRSSRSPPRTSTPTGRGCSTDYQSVEHVSPYDPNQALPVCDGQQAAAVPQAVNGIAYCGETRTIAFDHRLLPDVYDRSGDFGVAVVIAAEWAVAMQQDQGVTGDPKAWSSSRAASPGRGRATWSRGGHNPDGKGLTLSAGDLDEAIQSFLIFRDTDKISAGTGATAFENVDAFRLGFFQGESAASTSCRPPDGPARSVSGSGRDRCPWCPTSGRNARRSSRRRTRANAVGDDPLAVDAPHEVGGLRIVDPARVLALGLSVGDHDPLAGQDLFFFTESLASASGSNAPA